MQSNPTEYTHIQTLAHRAPRIAIVGAGISGLAAAYTLVKNHNGGTPKNAHADITLFEAGAYLGGHANTVDVTLEGQNFGVDTGFLVYNERTYPGLIALFEELDVEVAKSNMGFSVQVPERNHAKHQTPRMEWAGNSLSSVFAQRRNLLRPRFWAMLKDIVRFNRLTTQLAHTMKEEEPSSHSALQTSVGAFLREHRFGTAFCEDYFLPMVACIWSCPPAQMLAFPVETMVRFCHNHGLLQINQRPQWFTVRGGSREYVRKISAALAEAGVNIHLNSPVERISRHASEVLVHSKAGQERFDAIILATHSDQSLRILGAAASEAETALLSRIRYQANTAVLHTDTALLPDSRRAWAAWNYEAGADAKARVCLHYWLNDLQPLPVKTPIVVSLNPLREPRADTVLERFHYEHPIFDGAAIAAQAELHTIQNGLLDTENTITSRTWFAGAWQRYGFHEDGFQSGAQAARALLAAMPNLAQAPELEPDPTLAPAPTAPLYKA